MEYALKERISLKEFGERLAAMPRSDSTMIDVAIQTIYLRNPRIKNSMRTPFFEVGFILNEAFCNIPAYNVREFVNSLLPDDSEREAELINPDAYCGA